MVQLLLIALAFTCWAQSLISTFVVVIAGLDPFNYVFEDFLPHPYQRSMEIIVCSFLARLLLSGLCICEFIRFATFFVFLFTAMALLTVSSLTKIQVIHGSSCIHLYAQLRIIFAWAFSVLCHPFGLLMFLTHLATVFFLWFSICCRALVPLILSMITVVVGIFLIIYAAFVCTSCGVVREISESIIACNKVRNFSRRASRVNNKYYFYAVWRSQLPVRVPCGSLFTVKKSFTMAYLQELACNLTNAVLLFQPSPL